MRKMDYFVPGRRTEGGHRPWALARYLQPMPAGVAAAYAEACTEPGEVVLDPFCQSEVVVREAVEAGRKAIAVNFNPAIVLAVRGRLAWPDPRELDAAVTRLGDSPKLGVPLREHLEGLYQTPCPRCHRPAVADHFVWDREKREPVERSYRCQACGSEGTAPVEPADLEALERIETRGFHYWYILDRVAPPGDEGRDQAQRLLNLYTPRNLYALASLLIKIETLFPQSALRDALKTVLLSCLDSCSSLHPPQGGEAPPRTSRPRPPQRFVERNVWRAFEAAYDGMRSCAPLAGIRLAEGAEEIVAPDLLALAEGGPPNVLIKAWTVRRLARELPSGSVTLILADPPRPDPYFWALSYLWSGWLFGPRAAAPFKPLLRRKRSDWDWYCRAMEATFRALRRLLKNGGRLVLAFAEEADAPRPRLEALLLAASGAGFDLEGLAYRPDGEDEYRLSFAKAAKSAVEEVPAAPDAEALARQMRAQAEAAAQEVLRERGEPLAWPWLHAAIYHRLSRSGLLRQAMAVDEEGFSPLDFAAQQVRTALEEAEGLVRLGELWWLKEPGRAARPLADRVEEAVCEVLREAPSREALERAIYARFPGLLTPEEGLIGACLGSYGREVEPGRWQLRAEDQLGRRERQREEVRAHLLELGKRLGFAVQADAEGFDVLWREDGQVAYAFVVLRTAILSDVLLARGKPSGAQRCIAIPEERASLVEFKLGHNPLLRRAVAEGRWQFVKWPYLAQLAQAREVTRHDLKKIMGLRPIVERAEAQIPLF
ncbi:MAG TPA: hypothetical protein EYP09_07060 [Anaerolineae bacterium]|nr:hypothetical protein [Anaerolineae bacterium]